MRRIRQMRRWIVSTVLLTLGVCSACVSSPVLRPEAPAAPCAAASDTVRWLRAVSAGEAAQSDRWCAAIGAPAIRRRAGADAATPLTVISWNTHVGGGDVGRLVEDARSGRLTGKRAGDLVLLLQEVYRDGDSVPATPPPRSRYASAEQPAPPGGTRRSISAVADALGLSLFYVPSMRNGRAEEDRGNAILSSVAIDRLEAIELPLERQRRVAVAAEIRVVGRPPVTIRIVSTHFTNMVAHHLWLASEPGRVRQARALAQALKDDEPTVLGGDLNSWFGYSDGAFREIARILPLARPADRRPTFGPMRLDHIAARLPAGWRISVHRADSRYGSDHYPLVAIISN